jgi:hypothetical protein
MRSGGSIRVSAIGAHTYPPPHSGIRVIKMEYAPPGAERGEWTAEPRAKSTCSGMGRDSARREDARPRGRSGGANVGVSEGGVATSTAN